FVFFFQAEDGIRDGHVTGVQTLCSSDLVEETAALEVRGASSFGLKVVDLRDPVGVGQAADYRIEVANQGSTDGNGVQVRATIPRSEERRVGKECRARG